jgi:hypothetical protein
MVPRVITEQQAKIVQQLTNRTIWRLAKLLLRAKRKAELGELRIVEAWRIDKRSMDQRLQAVLAKRAEQYQEARMTGSFHSSIRSDARLPP